LFTQNVGQVLARAAAKAEEKRLAQISKKEKEKEKAPGGSESKAIASSQAKSEAPEKPDEPKPVGLNISFKQAAEVPTAAIALVGARVITMRGDEVLEQATVLVKQNRITAVGSAQAVTIPEGTCVIDCAGRTILPGFIDAHAHGAQGANGITPQQNWGRYADLAFGVTTIHDPSNDTESIFSASEMQRAGLIVQPRTFSTGTILYGAAGTYKAQIDNLEDALFHLKRMKAVGAFSVKSYNQPRRDQRQQVIEAARRLV
jgi:imidazolonepropionase-like amidohydrolase